MKSRMCLSVCFMLLAQSSFAQTFYDVGPYTGTQVECNTHGSGFFDYDNDGWDDIYVVHNTSLGYYLDLDNTLLKNLGNGWFSNVTLEAGAPGHQRYSAQGLAAGDYDNDGDTDMVIAMGSENRALFYINNGDGTFRWARLLPDADLGYAARCPAFFDYDLDGFLDMLFLRNSTPDKPNNPMFLLYRNDQRGGFYDVGQQSDLWRNVVSFDDLYGFALADVNLDGLLDFYVPRTIAPSLLLINNGNGTFWDKTEAYNLPRDMHRSGAVFLDYDNDGDWDLFTKRASPYKSQLFRNNGNRTFTDVSHESGMDIDLGGLVKDTVLGVGLTAGDFDNDGNTDILSINEFGWDTHLLHNSGNGTFSDATSGSNLSESQYRWYWTAPVADYNHDGYLDIYMARSPRKPTYASLYKNNGGSYKWLKLQLTGACRNTPRAGSNRSGVGARIVAFLGDQKMTRQVQGGDSYKVNSFTVHFGMKNAAYMDSVKIYWPSGIVQTGLGMPANSVIPIAEKDTMRYFGNLYVDGTVQHIRSGNKISLAVMNMTGEVNKMLLTDVNGYYQFRPIDYGTIYKKVPEKE